MPKKRLTKIDPDEKISRYINHEQNQRPGRHKKLSASLEHLRAERHRSLTRRLGAFLAIAVLAIVGLGYYVSPLANIASIKVTGAQELPARELVQHSGISAKGKLVDYLLDQGNISRRLISHYPELASVQLQVQGINQLVIMLHERPTVGYLKIEHGFKRLLSSGRLGTQVLTWSEVDQSRSLFINYEKPQFLKRNLQLFKLLPEEFQDQVKLISGRTSRGTQVVYVMKNGNVVVGNIDTFKNKVKYYDAISAKAGKYSLVDLEVGAFSRPLTSNEMKAYDIRNNVS